MEKMGKYEMLINGCMVEDLSCEICIVGNIRKTVDKMIDTLNNACGFIYAVVFDFIDVDGNELCISASSQKKHRCKCSCYYTLTINGTTFIDVNLPKETLESMLYQWLDNAYNRHNEVNNIELLEEIDEDFFTDEIEEIEEDFFTDEIDTDEIDEIEVEEDLFTDSIEGC